MGITQEDWKSISGRSVKSINRLLNVNNYSSHPNFLIKRGLKIGLIKKLFKNETGYSTKNTC